MRSSKRKREEEDAEEETPTVVAAEPVACSPPIVVDEISSSEVSVPQVPIPQVPVSMPIPEVYAFAVPAIPTRPKKRARMAVHTVARTAAAMAIGAAATWSALAFS